MYASDHCKAVIYKGHPAMRDQTIHGTMSKHLHGHSMVLLLEEQRHHLRINHAMINDSDAGFRVGQQIMEPQASLVRPHDQSIRNFRKR